MHLSASRSKLVFALCSAAAGIAFTCRISPAQAPDLDLARNLITQHRLAEGELTLRQCIALHPDSASAHYLLGYVLFSEQKANDSLAEYTIASRYRRPTAQDLIAVAADYVLLNDYEDADKWLSVATDMEPTNSLAWYYLGRARFYEQHFKESAEAFLKCLELNPRDVRAKTNLGLAYQELGREDDAVAAFQEAIRWKELTGEKDAQPYLDLGTLLSRRNRIGEAIVYLEKAAVDEPNNPRVLEELGHVYEKVHRLSEAEAVIRKAIRLAPDSSVLHFSLAHILKAEGKDAEAADEFATTRKLAGAHSSKEVSNFNLDR